MVFFKINSKSIKQPTEITLSFESLDKYERTMDGTMVADIIGKKARIDVRWDYMTDSDIKILTAEVRSGPFVAIDYCSAENQSIKSIIARAADLQYMPYYDWAKKQLMWQSILASFSER